MENSKHQQIIFDYVRSSNLERIIQNSIRSLMQSNILPDNPFGASTRHYTYFAAKDDLLRLKKKLRDIPLNELEFGEGWRIGHLKNASGLPQLLRYYDPLCLDKLLKRIEPFCEEYLEKIKDYRIEVKVSLGGGEIFKGKFLEEPGVAKNQLEIVTHCFLEALGFERAFEVFADFVYEDIMSIGNQNLNFVKGYYLENSNSTVLPFESIKSDKEVFVNELRSSVVLRREAYFKVLLFTQEFQGAPVSQSFEYVSGVKKYIFYHSEPEGNYKSYESSECYSIYETVFGDTEAAQKYSQVYYNADQNPHELSYMSNYSKLKEAAIAKHYKKGNNIKMLWEMFLLILNSPDIPRNDGVKEELLVILNHNSSKLYALNRLNSTLQTLINRFYDTNSEDFQKLAQGVFFEFKEKMISAFTNGSTAEMLIASEMIRKMLDSVSLNGSKTLQLHSYTLRVLERLQNLCSSLAQNSIELLLRNSPLISDFVQTVSKKFGIRTTVTQNSLLSKKQTKKVFDVNSQKKQLKLNETETIVHYLSKTGLLGNLVQTSKDLLLSYPLLPNPLKYFSKNLMSGISKFDMFSKNQLTAIQEFCNLPVSISEKVFMHDPVNTKYRSLKFPSLYGSEESLFISDIQEINFFAHCFEPYLASKLKFQEILHKNYTCEVIGSVCGKSLLSQSIEESQRIEWTYSYDFFIEGPSFNVSIQNFLRILIKYALWLDSSTEATVIGFFSPYSKNPIASLEDLINPKERQASYGLLLSAYQINTPVWLRFLIPYQIPKSKESKFFIVHLYFNLHYKPFNKHQWSSLRANDRLEDLIKVFFSLEDYQKYLEIAPDDFGDEDLLEKLFNHVHVSFSEGQYYRGYLYLLIAYIFQRNESQASRILTLNFTPLEIIFDLSKQAYALLDLVKLGLNNLSKLDKDLFTKGFQDFVSKCEKCIYLERNIYLESLQPAILRVVYDTQELLNSNLETSLLKVSENLKWVYKNINSMSKVCVLSAREVLKELISH